MGNTNTGTTLLKVMGILYIIFGAISCLLALVALVGSTAVATVSGSLGGLLILMTLISAAGGVLELVAGILGVKNCTRPEKANSCFVLGIIILVMIILGMIANFQWTSIIGLVISVLYVIGAYMVKKGQ